MSCCKKYFNNSPLPVTFYYTDEESRAAIPQPGSINRCVLGIIDDIRKGKSYSLKSESIGCFGGKKYLGFSEALAPNIEYFLSCGIPEKIEGERYKKSPELVKQLLDRWPAFKAPAPNIVFKRWDNLETIDNPEVVIFFVRPDALSGLYTLANYDSADPNEVVAPMGSGCASIIQNPYLGKNSSHPQAVIGLFDISARPFLGPEELTFAAPFNKFSTMVANMEESFLITKSWKNIQKRIS